MNLLALLKSSILYFQHEKRSTIHHTIQLNLLRLTKFGSLYPFSWLVDSYNKGGTSTSLLFFLVSFYSKNLTIVCVPFILYINFRTVGTLGPAPKFGLKNRVPKKQAGSFEKMFWYTLLKCIPMALVCIWLIWSV